MKTSKPRIAIVGGGISGLVAAYELAVGHPGLPFVLFESSARVGGIIETAEEQGFTIERGPDSWVTEKPWARELAIELGLADELIGSNDLHRRTYLLQGRTLVPMPEGMRMMVPTRWEPLLHSPLLSWQAKLAYLREPKRAEELKREALLARGETADESVADFVLRHFGEEAVRLLVGPLLSGVFGGNIHTLSVRAVMAPFVRMEAEHGSLIEALRVLGGSRPQNSAASTFTSLRSGMGTLVKRLQEKIPQHVVQLGSTVMQLRSLGTCWEITTGDRQRQAFDAVLLATPPDATRTLLASAQQELATEIMHLLPEEASSAVIAALLFRPETALRLRVPRGFGFLVPQSASRALEEGAAPLLACTFVDQKFLHRVPPGGVMLRGFFGGRSAEALEGRPDEEIAQHTRAELSRILGPLPAADVTLVNRWPCSLPQYAVGHVDRIERAERLVEKLPNLHLLGNAYHGVGLPDLIRDARQVARRVGESLAPASQVPA